MIACACAVYTTMTSMMSWSPQPEPRPRACDERPMGAAAAETGAATAWAEPLRQSPGRECSRYSGAEMKVADAGKRHLARRRVAIHRDDEPGARHRRDVPAPHHAPRPERLDVVDHCVHGQVIAQRNGERCAGPGAAAGRREDLVAGAQPGPRRGAASLGPRRRMARHRRGRQRHYDAHGCPQRPVERAAQRRLVHHRSS
jgi:hypothetical protein